MSELIDDSCVDNHRLAYGDSPEEVTLFAEAAMNGCCGSHASVVSIGGRKALIGCNFGH